MPASPHEAAWNEARTLLASAERLVTTSTGPGPLGAAVAHTDSAIMLLERLCAATPHPAPRRLLAAAWSLRARLRERVGSTDGLDDAVLAYSRAAEQLRQTPADADLQVRCDLAIALQQQGNSLQQRGGPGDLPAAITAYDEAITVLDSLGVESAPGLRLALGAVWLNRGAAWVRIDQADAPAESLRSFDAAIATWGDLPADAAPGQRLNLAAAWMNRSHTLLRSQENVAGARSAQAAAENALRILGELEREHAAGADLGLKARHILCRALGLLFAAPDSELPEGRGELIALATDTVDDGLSLARSWVQRQTPVPSAFVADLFRFGTQIYLANQPHFLAEFILDQLDPENSADALPWRPELHAIAREAVAVALHELERTHLVHVDHPGTERRIQSLHALRAAMTRLEALRAAAPRPT